MGALFEEYENSPIRNDVVDQASSLSNGDNEIW